MAHFYGSIKGSRGEATRCGHDRYKSMAQGWHGGVEVYLYKDENNVDHFEVCLTSGGNGGGWDIKLASGVLDYKFILEGKTTIELNDDLCRRHTEMRAREVMTEGVPDYAAHVRQAGTGSVADREETGVAGDALASCGGGATSP